METRSRSHRMTRHFVAALLAAAFAGESARAQSFLFRVDGPSPHAELGFSIACCADVDGDGVQEIVSGSDECPTAAGVDAGAIFVISGKTGAVLLRIDGKEASANLGFSVAVAGDVDGDGAPDCIGGEHWATANDH